MRNSTYNRLQRQMVRKAEMDDYFNESVVVEDGVVKLVKRGDLHGGNSEGEDRRNP
jgi:hypothetical protein